MCASHLHTTLFRSFVRKCVEMFYRAVVQAILLYDSQMWVLLAATERKVEGTHIVPHTYHGEASVEVRRQDVGDNRGGSIV